MGLVVVATVVAARLSAQRFAGELTGQLDSVRQRICTIGEGGEVPPRSGIAEIDAIGAAVTERDVELARRTATDRDFAADAAHQLRTPLTALLLRLEELATLDDVDAVHEEAQVAISQVERLGGVVEDLRARTRTGEVELPVISLDAVLARATASKTTDQAGLVRTAALLGFLGLELLRVGFLGLQRLGDACPGPRFVPAAAPGEAAPAYTQAKTDSK